MVEWIIPMVAGLIMDIGGAIVILKPLRAIIQSLIDHAERQTDISVQHLIIQTTSPDVSITAEIQNLRHYHVQQLRENTITFNMMTALDESTRSDLLWGLAFLAVGFSLQILSNVIQYYYPK